MKISITLEELKQDYAKTKNFGDNYEIEIVDIKEIENHVSIINKLLCDCRAKFVAHPGQPTITSSIENLIMRIFNTKDKKEARNILNSCPILTIDNYITDYSQEKIKTIQDLYEEMRRIENIENNLDKNYGQSL